MKDFAYKELDMEDLDKILLNRIGLSAIVVGEKI